MSVVAPVVGHPAGLSSVEAARRLAEYGPNSVDERPVPAWRRFLGRFWGPLPWMLEITIVLTVVLGKNLEAVIIAALLVVNSVIGDRQDARAGRARSQC